MQTKIINLTTSLPHYSSMSNVSNNPLPRGYGSYSLYYSITFTFPVRWSLASRPRTPPSLHLSVICKWLYCLKSLHIPELYSIVWQKTTEWRYCFLCSMMMSLHLYFQPPSYFVGAFIYLTTWCMWVNASGEFHNSDLAIRGFESLLPP